MSSTGNPSTGHLVDNGSGCGKSILAVGWRTLHSLRRVWPWSTRVDEAETRFRAWQKSMRLVGQCRAGVLGTWKK